MMLTFLHQRPHPGKQPEEEKDNYKTILIIKTSVSHTEEGPGFEPQVNQIILLYFKQHSF